MLDCFEEYKKSEAAGMLKSKLKRLDCYCREEML